jgi:fructose-1,6-bisphosphatase/inositol monophosphatase family enzyme
VALFEAGQPRAAVLDFPTRAHRFACGAETGAWLDAYPVVLRQARTVESARIAVSATQLRAPELRSVWSGLKVAEVVPTPAFTPKFATLFLGECDAAVHLPVGTRTTFLWDYAGAAMLLAEAGGQFITWDGRDVLQHLPARYTGGWLASTNNELLVQLRDTLQTALDCRPS